MTRLRLPVAGLFVLVLSACGGGGGSGNSDGGSVVTGNSGLVPTAPALGAIITTDAAVLRPIRDTAVWSYRGVSTAYTGATPVSYVTRTTQTAAGNGMATESLSNSSNAGPDTQSLSIGGGIVGDSQSIDFTGKGTPETIPFIEMRSPVRQGDQYTIWDRHYTDTNVDADGDNKPDALDVAIYGRVIGVEPLDLPGLPALSTVRVDITLRARVTWSSNGEASPVVESVIQTWYARGIGIVRQRSSIPTASDNDAEIIDEQLSAWDGITEGFGAMPARTAVVPVTDPIARGGSSIRGAAGFSDHVLVLLAGPFAADSTIARLDMRGQVVSSRIQPGIPAGSEGLVVPHRQGLVYLRQIRTQTGLTSTVALTRFDADGALVGSVAGATIDLSGPRTGPMFDPLKAAVDGTTLWLLWPRIYITPMAQERELVLRPYTLDGVPLGPELLVDPVPSTAQRIAGIGGRVLFTWGRFGNDYEAVYASAALGDTGVTVHPFADGTPGSTVIASQLLVPRASGAWGSLLWTAPLPDTPSSAIAGVLLDSSPNPIRAGSTLASEVLAGVPMSLQYAPAIDTTPDGSLLVLSAGTTVSWVTTGANAPLSARPVNRVGLIGTIVGQQVVFADRVVVMGGDGDGLASTVVWLNSGVAPLRSDHRSLANTLAYCLSCASAAMQVSTTRAWPDAASGTRRVSSATKNQCASWCAHWLFCGATFIHVGVPPPSR